MIYWIWFFALTALGCFLHWLSQQKNDSGDIRPMIFMASLSSMMMSLVFSYPVLGEVVYTYLIESLPNKGEGINLISVYIICGALSLCWISFPLLIGISVDLMHEKAAIKRENHDFLR